MPQLVLARQIAHLERAAMGAGDAPGLRVLWWQCVAKALQVHIAQEQGKGDMDSTNHQTVDADTDEAESGAGEQQDEWRVELSPAAALRYAEAGVVLEPQARALRADTPMATALRLRQKSWAQGLGLWVEIEGEGRLSAARRQRLPSGLRRREAPGAAAAVRECCQRRTRHMAGYVALGKSCVDVPRHGGGRCQALGARYGVERCRALVADARHGGTGRKAAGTCCQTGGW